MKVDWFKSAIVYQIYPRSFLDSSGDGIGDLKGIISKVDYLKDLGINALWLCPFYPSPNDDNGYDVSDYLGVHPDFGTLDDFYELSQALKQVGIKLIVDMVLNHSSDEHAWFIESSKSTEGPYSDYYVWKDPNGFDESGKPIVPNNWISIFGGSTWEWCESRQQYYLHLFTRKQPDLNWENPKVREELFNVVDTWAKRGVDGFRLDVINFISKKEGFPDLPHDLLHSPDKHYACGPRVHEFLQEFNRKVLTPNDSMTVGETPAIEADAAALYCDSNRNELDMIFGFDHTSVDFGPEGIWDSVKFRYAEFFDILSRWQNNMERLNGWNSIFVENHDQPRFISRICEDPKYLKEAAGLVATMLMTMKGTPYVYQGQEIGISNVAFESIDEYRDVWTLNYYNESMQNNQDPSSALKQIHYRSRDNARTPMHWNSGPQAGFTEGTPWIKPNPIYTTVNVENALKDQSSVFHTYKKLIAMKKADDVLIHGLFERIKSNTEQLFAYTRSMGSQRRLILLNFSSSEVAFDEISTNDYELIFSSQKRDTDTVLKPYEGRIYTISA